MFQFNNHRNLIGLHAFLGASNYHWTNYDDEKLLARYETYEAANRGTRLHNFAAESISLGVRLYEDGSTLSLYVNDAILKGMTPEQPLYYSENCFGTADAISFRNGVLRIHDLKTGDTPASLLQLRIYAAIFCLEYRMDPEKIDIHICIYQKCEKLEEDCIAADIRAIMDKIIRFDKLIMNRKREEEAQ